MYFTVAVVELANELNLGRRKREEPTPRILGNLGGLFTEMRVLRKEQYLWDRSKGRVKIQLN